MEQVRPEDMRISDAERNSAQEQLRHAHQAGQLDLMEFDERSRAVWAARTRADVVRVLGDLPVSPPSPARSPIFVENGSGTTMRILTTVWAGVSAVNFTIWALLTITSGEFEYPWWLWVAVPPGTVLIVLYLLGVGRWRAR